MGLGLEKHHHAVVESRVAKYLDVSGVESLPVLNLHNEVMFFEAANLHFSGDKKATVRM